MRVELPDGQWCVLRDPKKVPERLRRPCEQVIFHLSPEARNWMAENEDSGDGDANPLDYVKTMPRFSREDTDLLWEMNDLYAVALVAEWSFDGVPITLDTLRDLPGDAYDAIVKAIAPLVPDMRVTPAEPSKADYEGTSSATPTPPANA